MINRPFISTGKLKHLAIAGFLCAVPLFLASGAELKPVVPNVRSSEDAPMPQAVILSVFGDCQYSLEAGGKFKKLRVGDVLKEGAAIRTAENARIDLFLQRLAITVRLTPETDLVLEKMAKHVKQDVLIMETILDLRGGEIFCFVRGLVPNSRFEVKHAAGRSVVEGEGRGGYEIRADSAAVTPRTSFIPLKVISDTGVAVIAPGQKFDGKHKKTMQLAPTEVENTIMQLDELQALAELLSPDEEALKKVN